MARTIITSSSPATRGSPARCARRWRSIRAAPMRCPQRRACSAAVFKMSVVAVIDYGSGNLRSAAKAFERATRDAGGADRIVVTSDPRAVLEADRVVLPGVGAAGIA